MPNRPFLAIEKVVNFPQRGDALNIPSPTWLKKSQEDVVRENGGHTIEDLAANAGAKVAGLRVVVFWGDETQQYVRYVYIYIYTFQLFFFMGMLRDWFYLSSNFLLGVLG